MKSLKLLILLVIISLCSCNKFNKRELKFSSSHLGWKVLVTGCDTETVLKDTFDFSNSEIIISNSEAFRKNRFEVFLMDGVPFNPDDPSEGSNKLCYYMSSLGSGFNAEIFAKKNNLSFKKGTQEFRDFNFHFFKVGKTCNEDERSLKEFKEDIYRFIVENEVESNL